MNFRSSFSRRPDPDDDGRDPLAAAFHDYQPAPRDVAPRRARLEWSTADLDAIADTTTTVTHYEVTADGVTRHTEHLEITQPITERTETK